MTNTEDANWATAMRSDIGRVREGNEDACATEALVWVVADGLGGHAGGEIASAAAVSAAMPVLSGALGQGRPEDVLGEAFVQAHDAVRAQGRARRMPSMGTTLVAAYADPDGRVWVGSVGDSRAYLLTDGRLRALTTDDNYAADLLAAGVITEEESRSHPGQFMLTKALIAEDPQTPEPQVVPVRTAGRLLLCSDGLNAELSDSQIGRILGEGDVDAAADALIEAALRAGGSDNVTVICVDLPG